MSILPFAVLATGPITDPMAPLFAGFMASLPLGALLVLILAALNKWWIPVFMSLGVFVLSSAMFLYAGLPYFAATIGYDVLDTNWIRSLPLYSIAWVGLGIIFLTVVVTLIVVIACRVKRRQDEDYADFNDEDDDDEENDE